MSAFHSQMSLFNFQILSWNKISRGKRKRSQISIANEKEDELHTLKDLKNVGTKSPNYSFRFWALGLSLHENENS